MDEIECTCGETFDDRADYDRHLDAMNEAGDFLSRHLEVGTI